MEMGEKRNREAREQGIRAAGRILLPLVGEGGPAQPGRLRVLGEFQPSRGGVVRPMVPGQELWPSGRKDYTGARRESGRLAARFGAAMQNAEKISVTMTPEMRRVLRESVAAGEYASESEALRDAVRVWERQRLDDAERQAAIRARIRRSLDDPRPDLTEEEVRARLAQLHARMVKSLGDAAG